MTDGKQDLLLLLLPLSHDGNIEANLWPGSVGSESGGFVYPRARPTDIGTVHGQCVSVALCSDGHSLHTAREMPASTLLWLAPLKSREYRF